MNPTPHIRRSRPEEASALFKVFYSAVHLVASADYTPEQIEAWAPKEMDATLWEQHILGLNPFVAEIAGEVVGYADLQPNGYMDHFFVSGHHARRGIGSLLMRHVIHEAKLLGLSELTAEVSLTAQAFFKQFGFAVVELRYPERGGVIIPNALMRCSVASSVAL